MNLLDTPRSSASPFDIGRMAMPTIACGFFVGVQERTFSGEIFDLGTIAPLSSSTEWSEFPSNSSALLTFADLPPIQAMERLFQFEGFRPTGSAMTADESKIFEFLGEIKVGVDVCPTGEVTVMVRRADGGTDYYALDADKPKEIVKTLKDVGVPRGLQNRRNTGAASR